MIRIPRFRFRLVHLFVLLTILCVVCGVIVRDAYVTNRVSARVYELGGHAYRDPTLIGKVLEYLSIDGGDVGEYVEEVYFHASYCWPCPIYADCSCLHISSDDLDDDGLAVLIPELERLSKPFKLTVIGTSITDAGMRGLRRRGVGVTGPHRDANIRRGDFLPAGGVDFGHLK